MTQIQKTAKTEKMQKTEKTLHKLQVFNKIEKKWIGIYLHFVS